MAERSRIVVVDPPGTRSTESSPYRSVPAVTVISYVAPGTSRNMTRPSHRSTWGPLSISDAHSPARNRGLSTADQRAGESQGP